MKKFIAYLFDSISIGYLIFIPIWSFLDENDDELLQLNYNLKVFGFCVAVGAILSLILYAQKISTLGQIVLLGSTASKIFWRFQSFALVVLTFIVSYFATKMSIVQILEKDSFDHAVRLLSQMARPDWQILPKAIVKIIETILIAFMATALALPLAFALSFFSAKNLMQSNRFSQAIYFLLRLAFNVMRSIEPILWAIVFSVWVGFGPYAGMLALFVHSLASLSKQFSEIIEGVEDGPIEAIESTGANRLQVIWFAIVPQVILPFISFTIYRWDINVRMATIIGFVGGGGIGASLLEAQGQAQWSQVGCIILVIAIVVWLMDTFSAYVRAAVK